MRPRAAVLSLVVAATLTAHRAHASGGFLPPLEVQYGDAVTGGPADTRIVQSQLLVGVSWASLYPKSTPVDISAGVIATFSDDDTTVPAGGDTARRLTTPTPSHDAVGGYLYLARAIDTRSHFRTWLGARGELMGTDGVGVLGGALRTSFELWTGAMAADHSSGIMGTVALGLWAEVGIREQADRSVASFAAAGLGIRLPMIAVK